ncbi:hypothetical protein [Streptomyces tubercidicus]|uniref:hypothetical protein n=1 Tax=Streptomyces tubercidicus TaxID=47759 RepID=UPI0036D065C4
MPFDNIRHKATICSRLREAGRTAARARELRRLRASLGQLFGTVDLVLLAVLSARSTTISWHL